MTFTPEIVAEMCSTCEFDYYAQAKPEQRHIARKWCNQIGEKVIGYGPTAWAAVQHAYELHQSYYSKAE